MTHMHSISDSGYLNDQYRNADKLNIRMIFHQKFSTNLYGWHAWLFDQIEMRAPDRVLELGCGTGQLWLENLQRIPAGMDITLSDISEGMLAQAEQNLSEKFSQFLFKVIDVQSIPFEDDTFDVVIANHMLYHVPDRMKAIREIRRVLKPDGSFYASTNGSHNLFELGDLLGRFDPQLCGWQAALCDTFLLDNGAKQLEEFFSDVTLSRYSDSLQVTDAKLLIEYVLSGRLGLPPDRKMDFLHFIEQEMQVNGGKIHISKEAGVFIAAGQKE